MRRLNATVFCDIDFARLPYRFGRYCLVMRVARRNACLRRLPTQQQSTMRPRRHRRRRTPRSISFQLISASRGAVILRSIYPNARITVDSHANAVVVVASGYNEQGMRTIASGIDVKTWV
jgi:hypothetical protein